MFSLSGSVFKVLGLVQQYTQLREATHLHECLVPQWKCEPLPELHACLGSLLSEHVAWLWEWGVGRGVKSPAGRAPVQPEYFPAFL